MAWWQKLLPLSRKSSTDSMEEIFRGLLGGRLSKSGKRVTREEALKVATVFACARVIAEGLAQVPLKLYKLDGNKKLPATDHPL
jgi:phage portal protein BeeE